MEELLRIALEKAYARTYNASLAITSVKTVEVEIRDVKPSDLLEFMKENNIPMDAEFSTDDDNNVVLCYNVPIETIDAKREKFIIDRFERYAWNEVYRVLTDNDYGRIACDTNEFRKYENPVIMYRNNDWVRLVAYYGLRFRKGEE